MFCSGLWVKTILGKKEGKEKGQVMLMSLVVLTVGTLIITPLLHCTYTGVKAAGIYRRVTHELYAADAGVEYAMWQLKNDLPVSASITIGNMPVSIDISQLSELPYGPVISDTGPQSWRLEVSSSLVDNRNGTFNDTVTVANVGPSTIHLIEIGAGLPEGFTFISGSTTGDITAQNPSEILADGKIYWTLNLHKLNSDESACHIFLIQGSGLTHGIYSWVTANAESIGTISSCLGYHVESRANNGTRIKAKVVKNGGYVFPVSWEVN
jgi:uncharacterized repeat protein (TIGR01451 family)